MKSVVTIGTFDAVHLGHQALIRRARQIAEARGGAERPDVVVLAFDPHPAAVLRPGEARPRLTTFAQRSALLRAAGADRVERLEPTRELLGLTPEEFVARLVREHAPAAIVEGPDFRFGKGRGGDVQTLGQLGALDGFSVEVVQPVQAVLSDHSEVLASSTITRWLVSNGRVKDAAAVLGRPYSVVGRVVRGDRRGRELGIPTANIETECLLPVDGVYAGRAIVADGRSFAAAVSVGSKPQFDGCGRALEAHLLQQAIGTRQQASGGEAGAGDWAPLPGLPEYGWGVELELVSWLRDQAKFDSVIALLGQIRRDCQRVLQTVGAQHNACAEVVA